MTGVTLIQCTDTKRDEPAPAWHLYEPSNYFTCQRRWALARGQPWYILSAKHGLVHPGRPLRPYDAYGLSAEQAETIATTLADRGVTAVHLNAGRAYTDALVPALERAGMTVFQPFEGLRIGSRMSELNAEAERLRGEV